MNILFVNKFFYLNGGSESVFFQERVFLKNCGFSLVDFAMKDDRNFSSEFSDFFVNPVFYRAGPISERLKSIASFIHSKEAVLKISNLLETTHPDIVHLHNIYHQLTPSIIPILRNHGVRTVLTLHDGKLACPSYLMLNKGKPCLKCAGKNFHLPFTTNCQNSRVSGLLLMLEAYFHIWKKSYDAVDAFIVPSQFLSDVVAPRIGTQKTHLIRNGIDHTKFQPSDTDKGYLLYIGRLSAEKGVGALLKAHASMTNPVPLVIVGTGPMEKELRIQASSNVTFTGYCSGEDLWSRIQEASCLIVPSECYENAPMTVLEGMAFGKPIIASRIGGIPEQVLDGDTGLLFEPGNVAELADAMGRMMDSPFLRKTMGGAGRARLEQEFTLDMHNQKVLALYHSILAK